MSVFQIGGFLGKYSLSLLESIHSRLQDNKVDECQFCERLATVMICNVRHEPTFWMCDLHSLLFIKGLLDDITSTKGSTAVKELIGEQQEEQKKERQALHIS
jgi:hypothetical protein